jgi:hypothetical protein
VTDSRNGQPSSQIGNLPTHLIGEDFSVMAEENLKKEATERP